MENTGGHEESQACTRQSIPDYCAADCCALRSVVSFLRKARLSVCTIRMRVSCVQSASAPPRPPSSMQTVAGCVHGLHKPGVCGVPATVAHGRPLWAVGPGEPCAVVDCDRSNHALGSPRALPISMPFRHGDIPVWRTRPAWSGVSALRHAAYDVWPRAGCRR